MPLNYLLKSLYIENILKTKQEMIKVSLDESCAIFYAEVVGAMVTGSNSFRVKEPPPKI